MRLAFSTAMPGAHDALFHAIFSRVDVAAGQLRSVLPRDIASRIDWSSLRLEDGHYVDEDLASRQSDLLYSASLQGHPALLYVLFEHQSTCDPLMPFRLLRYTVRVADRWLAEHQGSRTVPVILPVVMAHAEGGWQAATSMDALYALPDELMRAVAPHVPRFRFVLDDLAVQNDEALMARAFHALGVLGLLMLRHGRETEDLPKLMVDWAALFVSVWRAPDGPQALATLIRYAMLVNRAATIQDLTRALVPVLGQGAEAVIMTEGQRLIQQGRAEGEAKGEARGRASALLAVFSARGMVFSSEQRERILSCQDLAILDRWIHRAATAASVDESLGEGN